VAVAEPAASADSPALAAEPQDVRRAPALITPLALSLGAQLSIALLLPARGVAAAGCPDRTARRLSFETSGHHSDFVLSSSGHQILFTEDAEVKAVSTDDGSVVSLRKLPVGTPNSGTPGVAAVPDHPATLVLYKQRGDFHSAFDIWLEPLTAHGRRGLDVGEDGSDGRVVVSDSGRYLATGTAYGCSGGDHDCFARSCSVFSTETGARVFSIPVPTTEEVGPDATGQGTEVIRSSQLRRTAWAKNDVLVLKFYDGSTKAFAADPSGSWNTVSNVPIAPVRSRSDAVYGPKTDLTTTEGESLGTAVLSCYFGSEPGQVQILRGRNEVVLLKPLASIRSGRSSRFVGFCFRAR
jgi:hypothetical protein